MSPNQGISPNGLLLLNTRRPTMACVSELTDALFDGINASTSASIKYGS